MRWPLLVVRLLLAGSNAATISCTHCTPAGWKSALRSRTFSIGQTPLPTSV